MRVRAENKIGIGEPLESQPTVAKHMFDVPGPPGKPVASDITENAVTVGWAIRPIMPPGPPVNPKLKDWSKEWADLVWTKPTRDGGSPILGYIVECQKAGSAQWNRMNKDDLIKQCAFRAPGLIEGTEYRFRIKAANVVGEGEPRELPESVIAKDILQPPEINIDVSCRDLLTVRVGQTIGITARVKGRPYPDITWSKEGRLLARDKRTEMRNDYPVIELSLKEATRADHGKYTVLAKNSSVLAIDPVEKPGEPENLHIADVGKTFVLLKWRKPDYDGGSPNLSYHVERKLKDSEEWERVHKGSIKETHFMVDKCIENQIYQFRVQTKNEGGESNWVKTSETLVKQELQKPVLDVKLSGTLVVKAGDSIRIEAGLRGKPDPEVTWVKDKDPELSKSPRLSIETTKFVSDLQSWIWVKTRLSVSLSHAKSVRYLEAMAILGSLKVTL
uniref:Titin n=1 Tax=Erpetoichthys calabaricus TaxID=27687 RepID=A0A8C4S5K6_ERPCA